ncbi:MAG TPA: tRNA lysidine(34) synthetase TilS, partial [Thermodesulfobacteriota bacterium]|nr:tRNA lysidine(34) synthetase TilS [Thermodesulfobacteriota bacterium]
MHPLILRLKKTIRKYGMLQPGDKIVVGVSGGADSMALLRALWEIRGDLHFSMLVAHLDHGLRPEGEKEANFVRKEAGRLGIPFFHRKADVRAWKKDKGLATQEAARDLRYAFLREMAETHEASKIALGHTADDQAE